MTPIRLNASTREDRNQTIFQVKEAMLHSGGYILDYHMFSNISISLQFELPAEKLEQLLDELRLTNLRMSDASEALIANWSRRDKEQALDADEETVAGSLQITFIHNEPDLKMTIPAIPG